MNGSPVSRPQVAIEGVAMHLAAQALCGLLLVPWLQSSFPSAPPLTIAIAGSSAVAPVAASLFIRWRTAVAPSFRPPLYSLTAAVLSLVLAPFVSFLAVLLVPEDPYLAAILSIAGPAGFFTTALITVWIPAFEEVLYRGYCLALLLPRFGAVRSSLFSSILFVIPHGIWSSWGLHLALIFLFSLVFSFIYLRGGLAMAILGHIIVVLYQVLHAI